MAVWAVQKGSYTQKKKSYVETSLNFELACNQAPLLRCRSNRDYPPRHKTADKNKILTSFVSSAFGLKTPWAMRLKSRLSQNWKKVSTWQVKYYQPLWNCTWWSQYVWEVNIRPSLIRDFTFELYFVGCTTEFQALACKPVARCERAVSKCFNKAQLQDSVFSYFLETIRVPKSFRLSGDST